MERSGSNSVLDTRYFIRRENFNPPNPYLCQLYVYTTSLYHSPNNNNNNQRQCTKISQYQFFLSLFCHVRTCMYACMYCTSFLCMPSGTRDSVTPVGIRLICVCVRDGWMNRLVLDWTADLSLFCSICLLCIFQGSAFFFLFVVLVIVCFSNSLPRYCTYQSLLTQVQIDGSVPIYLSTIAVAVAVAALMLLAGSLLSCRLSIFNQSTISQQSDCYLSSRISHQLALQSPI